MATTTRTSPANASPSISSVVSLLKAYSVPLILFAASLFFQLIVIPRSFPPSHYDALGIKRYSSIEEVTQAYEKLTSKWNSGLEVPSTIDFVKAQYAFELLTNEFLKRDYDTFGIDEQLHVIEKAKEQYSGANHVIEKAKEQYSGANVSQIDLPLLEPPSFDPAEHAFSIINTENFLSNLGNSKALLIQVFSYGGNRCGAFSHNWKRIVTLLDGVANTGMVELGDVNLAAYLAEKRSSGQPFFRNGLPTLIAFPPGCNSSNCLHRYGGELSVDAVTDWFATTILNLPRILYYSKDSMAQNFLGKSKPHQVKVIFFSTTGERAPPLIRQAAKTYWNYATFAFILWREDESSLWWNMLGVESAPAIVFLKDPGIKPVVYHGFLNSSMFLDIMEKNKHQVLPQLRSVTSMDLGCDARGYSRAGKDTRIWYCVILAGRLSQELNSMRETMRRVQEKLSNDGELNVIDQDPSLVPAALALKQKRLTFTWLDGEAQQRYCFFHINSEDSYKTCGPRRGIEDVAQLLIVRYERNNTEDGNENEREPKSYFQALNYVVPDPAGQLVAKYKGSGEISEIIKWLSEIITDGDSQVLPPFKTKAPELVPEDAYPVWSAGSWNIISATKEVKQRIINFIYKMHNQLGDPRIGPALLLAALVLFGRIWLSRSESSDKIDSNSSTQPRDKDKVRPNRRSQPSRPRNELIPPSITDLEPKDAHQMQFSDSDSDN